VDKIFPTMKNGCKKPFFIVVTKALDIIFDEHRIDFV
jgi:hypothetical protein